jgi:CDGSH-type Zn-finger protein
MEPARTTGTVKINIIKDGPYRVAGGVPLSTQAIGFNEARESVEWIAVGDAEASAPYFLCRCGHSANKPFCDGSHATVGFDGAETAARAAYDDQAGQIAGPALTLSDAESLCAGARFCDRAGTVWASVETATTDQERQAFAQQVGQCPSGRLVARDRQSGAALEPMFEPSIVLVEDPAEGVSGPLWVRGGIQIVGSDGVALEVRNRVTLCRCGASANKPYCDGSHARAPESD